MRYRADYAFLGHNGGDKSGGCDVETGMPGFNPFRGHEAAVNNSDLLRGAFLYLNSFPRLKRGVNGRCGGYNIKRYPVISREYGQGVGAYLVGCVAVGRYPVSAHDHGVITS